MKLFIEEHQYTDENAKALLHKILNFEQGGVYSPEMVGYYYSNQINDTVFFLPKVVMDKDDKVFHQYKPENIIDLQSALDNKTITEDDYRFIYGLSVWIYRSISVFRKYKVNKILLYHDIPTDNMSGHYVYNTFLDILISIQRFNDENQNFFTFVLKNIHSGFNKINWTKTISRSYAIIQDDTPIYLDVINRKRQVNYEEELFIIFFSILHYMQVRYGFPVTINYNYSLITEETFDNYLDGYGVMRLLQIRHRYFADKMVQMWQLCFDFFSMQSQIHNRSNYEDYLLSKDFNIVFEEMVDHLLSDKDRRVDNMHLKDQPDGKRVDHIYSWRGLMHNEDEIFYIGDSKYYKQANNPEQNSIYKQYTYARNVIQANLKLFYDKDDFGNKTQKVGEDYLIYRDDDTEGYNITPNFFIRAHIPEDRGYEKDDLESKGEMEKIFHFENRLFDRDTLLLQHYDINFLYILAVYGSEDVLAQQKFKMKARDMFRNKIIEDIKKHYNFFSLQPKPVDEDIVDEDDDEKVLSVKEKTKLLIEQKYFHKLLGKAFRPYKEEDFMYLSLESKEEFLDDNIKLLANLSQDFNIRHYELGTDPRNEINKFADLTSFLTATPTSKGNARIFRFEEFNDEVFLIGGYRSGDKNQLEWIHSNMMYNIRASVNRHGYNKGIIDNNVISARFLILYEINDKEKHNYQVYRIESFKIRSEEWMLKNGYENPNGSYIVYKLGNEVFFEKSNVNLMLTIKLYKEIELRKKNNETISDDWINNEWNGAPVFLTGKEIDTYALVSHRDSNKALVVVNIKDTELSKIGNGYSATMFITKRAPFVINDFTRANYIIYSNKTNHKIYNIIGDASISIQSPDGYLARRYAETLKDSVPDRKERDKIEPDFSLSFAIEPSENELGIAQSEINKVPKGLSGYDAHIIEIDKLTMGN